MITDDNKMDEETLNKQFPMVSISREDIRTMYGKKWAERLSDEDRKYIAEEMGSEYVYGAFVADLGEILVKLFADDDEEVELVKDE